MRLFTAIAFNYDVKNEIAKYYTTLKDFGINGSFTSKNNLHLTLKFLGEVNSSRLYDIKACVEEVASKIEQFEIESTGCGYFSSRGDKTVWLGMDGSNLLNLATAVDESFSSIGFSRETRKFTPHITLVRRVKADNGDFSKLPQINVSFNVTSITLFESRRDQGRLVYKPIFVANLK